MALTGISSPGLAEENPVPLQGNAVLPKAGMRDELFSCDRAWQFMLSIADQGLAVGGVFLANVALARTGTKEEYGMFALSYSLFTFLTALHNAAILEPFTVYGSGRYRDRFSGYLRLMARSNLSFSLLLSGLILLACLVLWRVAPHLVSRALVGLGLTVGVLLSGIFLRRAFYVRREPALAAKSSLVFFITVVLGLGVTLKLHLLNSLSVFGILALGWTAARASYGRKLTLGKEQAEFLDIEPGYWGLHWKYMRWVLTTAFVFQLMTQGYYWLVAGFLSVKQVAELRAIYMLVTPIDQVFIALTFLVLPALASRYASGRMQAFRSLQKRYTIGVLCTTALFVFAVRIAGKPVMHLLYAGKFDDLVPLLYLLAFSPLVMGLGNSMNDALKAVEKPSLVFYAYVCSGVATIVGGIPFVMHFGVRGAVYGILLSGAVYTTTLVVCSFLVVYRKANRLNPS